MVSVCVFWFNNIVFGFLASPYTVVSLLQSPCPSSPLPGAFDRRALGAVIYLMAHTIPRITPAL